MTVDSRSDLQALADIVGAHFDAEERAHRSALLARRESAQRGGPWVSALPVSGVTPRPPEGAIRLCVGGVGVAGVDPRNENERR